MSQENNKDKNKSKDKALPKDIVKSVFDQRKEKKKTSALFDLKDIKENVYQKVHDAVVPQPKVSKLPRNTKLLPVGIDIGFSSIKIVQLALVNNKLSIAKLILREFPIDFVTGDDKKRQLKEFLRETIEKNGIKGEAFATLPTDMVEFKNITLPKMPINEIAQAVRWEIKRMGPANIDDLSFDYIVLNQDEIGRAEEIEILAVMSKKQDVLNYLSLVESSGLSVEAIEAEPLSLIAGLDYNQSIPAKGVVMFLDVGGGGTRVNMVKDKELQFTRILNINGNSLTSAIKDYCQVSYKEAEEFKRKYGAMKTITSDAQAVAESGNMNQAVQIKNAITLLLERLVSDIDHTFKYYSYQLTKSQVHTYDKIILSGGMANFKMLIPFLEDRLNVPVEVYNPLKILEVNAATIMDGDNLSLDKDAARFGVAIGLALRGLE